MGNVSRALCSNNFGEGADTVIGWRSTEEGRLVKFPKYLDLIYPPIELKKKKTTEKKAFVLFNIIHNNLFRFKMTG